MSTTYFKAILTITVLSLFPILKYFLSDSFRLFRFRLAKRVAGLTGRVAEENWKKVRDERKKWDDDHPFAPRWHHERQELLRRELGLFMLFVDKGPQFSQALIECRGKDIKTLAAQICDEGEIFQNQDESDDE